MRDIVVDGDRSRARGPDSDVLAGGLGRDLLSYASRTRGVRVDLARRGPAGQRGEGDLIRGFEGAVGGKGPDHLAGTQGMDALYGLRDADVLTGRGGRGAAFRLADELDGGLGPDRLVGGRGDNRLRGGRGIDVLACGPDGDFAGEPEPGELLTDCEYAYYSWQDFIDGDSQVQFSPHPTAVSADAVDFALACAINTTDQGDEPRCDSDVELREAGGAARLLGTGRMEGGYVAPTRVELTPLGRELVPRPGGVVATVRLLDFNPFPIGWTIRLER
jgi:hypothetical protein